MTKFFTTFFKWAALFLFVAAFFTIRATWGADPIPFPSPSMGVGSQLANASTQIDLFVAGGLFGGFVVLAEIIMRLVPTEKALSWMYLGQAFFYGLALLSKSLGDALGKIIPQRIKKE